VLFFAFITDISDWGIFTHPIADLAAINVVVAKPAFAFPAFSHWICVGTRTVADSTTIFWPSF